MMAEEGAEQADKGLNYNPIFAQLVDGDGAPDNELLGMVAYALYKKAKREWALGVLERTGIKPSEGQLSDYMRSWTPSRVEGLKTEAAGILAEFADIVVQAQEPRILREAVKGRFWRAVATSMAASFFYTVILIAVAVVLAYTKPDLLSIFSDVSRR